MTEGRKIDYSNRDDLAYLEAYVDLAPLLSERNDIRAPLTENWKLIIKGLINTIRWYQDQNSKLTAIVKNKIEDNKREIKELKEKYSI